MSSFLSQEFLDFYSTPIPNIEQITVSVQRHRNLEYEESFLQAALPNINTSPFAATPPPDEQVSSTTESEEVVPMDIDESGFGGGGKFDYKEQDIETDLKDVTITVHTQQTSDKDEKDEKDEKVFTEIKNNLLNLRTSIGTITEQSKGYSDGFNNLQKSVQNADVKKLTEIVTAANNLTDDFRDWSKNSEKILSLKAKNIQEYAAQMKRVRLSVERERVLEEVIGDREKEIKEISEEIGKLGKFPNNIKNDIQNRFDIIAGETIQKAKKELEEIKEFFANMNTRIGFWNDRIQNMPPNSTEATVQFKISGIVSDIEKASQEDSKTYSKYETTMNSLVLVFSQLKSSSPGKLQTEPELKNLEQTWNGNKLEWKQMEQTKESMIKLLNEKLKAIELMLTSEEELMRQIDQGIKNLQKIVENKDDINNFSKTYDVVLQISQEVQSILNGITTDSNIADDLKKELDAQTKMQSSTSESMMSEIGKLEFIKTVIDGQMKVIDDQKSLIEANIKGLPLEKRTSPKEILSKILQSAATTNMTDEIKLLKLEQEKLEARFEEKHQLILRKQMQAQVDKYKGNVQKILDQYKDEIKDLPAAINNKEKEKSTTILNKALSLIKKLEQAIDEISKESDELKKFASSTVAKQQFLDEHETIMKQYHAFETQIDALPAPAPEPSPSPEPAPAPEPVETEEEKEEKKEIKFEETALPLLTTSFIHSVLPNAEQVKKVVEAVFGTEEEKKNKSKNFVKILSDLQTNKDYFDTLYQSYLAFQLNSNNTKSMFFIDSESKEYPFFQRTNWDQGIDDRGFYMKKEVQKEGKSKKTSKKKTSKKGKKKKTEQNEMTSAIFKSVFAKLEYQTVAEWSQSQYVTPSLLATLYQAISVDWEKKDQCIESLFHMLIYWTNFHTLTVSDKKYHKSLEKLINQEELIDTLTKDKRRPNVKGSKEVPKEIQWYHNETNEETLFNRIKKSDYFSMDQYRVLNPINSNKLKKILNAMHIYKKCIETIHEKKTNEDRWTTFANIFQTGQSLFPTTICRFKTTSLEKIKFVKFSKPKTSKIISMMTLQIQREEKSNLFFPDCKEDGEPFSFGDGFRILSLGEHAGFREDLLERVESSIQSLEQMEENQDDFKQLWTLLRSKYDKEKDQVHWCLPSDLMTGDSGNFQKWLSTLSPGVKIPYLHPQAYSRGGERVFSTGRVFLYIPFANFVFMEEGHWPLRPRTTINYDSPFLIMVPLWQLDPKNAIASPKTTTVTDLLRSVQYHMTKDELYEYAMNWLQEYIDTQTNLKSDLAETYKSIMKEWMMGKNTGRSSLRDLLPFMYHHNRELYTDWRPLSVSQEIQNELKQHFNAFQNRLPDYLLKDADNMYLLIADPEVFYYMLSHLQVDSEIRVADEETNWKPERAYIHILQDPENETAYSPDDLQVTIRSESGNIRTVSVVTITDWLDPIVALSRNELDELSQDLMHSQSKSVGLTSVTPGYSLNEIGKRSLFQRNLLEFQAMLQQMHGRFGKQSGSIIRFAHETQSRLIQGEVMARSNGSVYNSQTRTVHVLANKKILSVPVVNITHWLDLSLATGDETRLGAVGDFVSKAAVVLLYKEAALHYEP